MRLIKGIHHISMKCCDQQEYKKVLNFYHKILGMEISRNWSEGTMFDAGGCVIEIFKDGDIHLDKGIIRHFALATDNVDACIQAVRSAGYEILAEPKDIVIPSEPPYPARIAFCKGPLGEEIEFFQIR